jgi:ABC-type branched-subunit amino acid transport system ATPase component/ABC-type branched-subunit amino acid transport system permease subunit
MLNFDFGIFGIDGTGQLLFNGLVTGMVFGLLAMGIVLVYRSTRVINFAVGNMGVPASVLLALMVINYGFPYWVALPLAILVGTLIGAIVELAVIRRLFHAPRVILLVATIGVAQLMQAITSAYPDIDTSGRPNYPVPVDTIWEDLLGLRVRGPQLTIIIVVPLLAIALGVLMNRTAFGKAVQASASNADLARTNGISPKLVSTAVWTIAGFLATVSAILLSGQQGSIAGFESLGPNTLARALAAAVLAGMVSFRRALAAGVAIGLIQSLIQFNFLDSVGLFDFLLFVGVAAAVYLQARSDEEKATFSFAPKARPIPDAIRHIWWVRNLPAISATVLFLAAAAVPFISDTPSRLLIWSTIVVYAICASSVTIVTGWSGQLSLGQMALAGIGAFSAAMFARGGVPWVASLFLGAFVAGLVAAAVGAGALRVRGLFLAVVTFTFGLAANQFLFRRDFFSDGNRNAVPFGRGELFGLELTDERTYYWFVLGLLAICFATVATLRRSGIGRSIIAVRDNPETAAAYTVNPTTTRLLSFAISGAIAGLGGAALGGLLQQLPLQGRFFQPFESLRIVSMAVIGGLGSVVGPVLGAGWVEGLRGLFPDNELVPLFTSSLGLLLLLLYFPGGFVQIGYSIRDSLFRWMADRRPAVDTSRNAAAPVPARLRSADRAPATLVVDGVSVQFGGNTAVSKASLHVNHGEIVGLIGTNGAGKSTLMNAVGGFVPTSGSVELLGVEMIGTPSHRRATAGLGRTFQAATLFPELTVLETVQVALEAQRRTRLLGTALHSPVERRHERERALQARELIEFLGLGRYANSYIAELSTGTRRIVELAGLLALDARLLCLDEPTAGVAQRESEAFGPLLRRIRDELDASILIIEHDMPMIMSISDRVYCLDQGQVIAEGTPAEVRNDPAVVASYLGTDDRAIDRSDAN